MYVPTKIYLTKGIGKHREKLTSFEMALRNADIAPYNIVRVSSIFPPNCRLIPKSQGKKYMKAGQIAHVVMSESATNEPHRLIAASIGVAIPSDRTMHGYLSEHHSCGQNTDQAGEYAEDLAASMLATILGVEFDPDKSWIEKKQIWKISKQIFKTTNVTQSAIGDRKGLWTTVIAAAVLIP